MIAGSIIGIRQTLTGIVSATLVFTGSSFPEVTHMFSFGICMTPGYEKHRFLGSLFRTAE